MINAVQAAGREFITELELVEVADYLAERETVDVQRATRLVPVATQARLGPPRITAVRAVLVLALAIDTDCSVAPATMVATIARIEDVIVGAEAAAMVAEPALAVFMASAWAADAPRAIGMTCARKIRSAQARLHRSLLHRLLLHRPMLHRPRLCREAATNSANKLKVKAQARKSILACVFFYSLPLFPLPESARACKLFNMLDIAACRLDERAG